MAHGCLLEKRRDVLQRGDGVAELRQKVYCVQLFPCSGILTAHHLTEPAPRERRRSSHLLGTAGRSCSARRSMARQRGQAGQDRPAMFLKQGSRAKRHVRVTFVILGIASSSLQPTALLEIGKCQPNQDKEDSSRRCVAKIKRSCAGSFN